MPDVRIPLPLVGGIHQQTSVKNTRPPGCLDVVNIRFDKGGALSQRPGSEVLNGGVVVDTKDNASGIFSDSASIKALTAGNAYWYDPAYDRVVLCQGAAAGAQLSRIPSPPISGEVGLFDSDIDVGRNILGILYRDEGVEQTMAAFIDLSTDTLIRPVVPIPEELSGTFRILSLGLDLWAIVGTRDTSQQSAPSDVFSITWGPTSGPTSPTNVVELGANVATDLGPLAGFPIPIDLVALTNPLTNGYISFVGRLRQHNAAGLVTDGAPNATFTEDLCLAADGSLYGFSGSEIIRWANADVNATPTTVDLAPSVPYLNTGDNTVGQLNSGGSGLTLIASTGVGPNSTFTGINVGTSLVTGDVTVENSRMTFFVDIATGPTPAVQSAFTRHGIGLVAKCKSTSNADFAVVAPNLTPKDAADFTFTGTYLIRLRTSQDNFDELTPVPAESSSGEGQDILTVTEDALAAGAQGGYTQNWAGIQVLARLGGTQKKTISQSLDLPASVQGNLPKFFNVSDERTIVPFVEESVGGPRMVLANVDFDLKDNVPEAEEPRGLTAVTGGLLNIFDNNVASEYAITHAPLPSVTVRVVPQPTSFRRIYDPQWTPPCGVRLRYVFKDSFGNIHEGPEWWNGELKAMPDDNAPGVAYLIPPPVTNREDNYGELYSIEMYFVGADGIWKGGTLPLRSARRAWAPGFYFASFRDIGLVAKDFQLSLGTNLIGGQEIETTPLNAVADIAVTRDRLFALDYKGRDIFYSKPMTYTDNNFPVFSALQVLNTDSQGGEVVAIEGLDDKLVIFKKESIEVVFVGQGPNAFGVGPPIQAPRQIPSDGGCVSRGSVITGPPGIFFQSQAGIYLLDRQLRLGFVGDRVEDITNANLMRKATVLPAEKEVVFQYGEDSAIAFNYEKNVWSRFTNFPSQGATTWRNSAYLMSRDNKIYKYAGIDDEEAPVETLVRSGWFTLEGLSPHFKVKEIQVRGSKASGNDLVMRTFYNYNSTPGETIVGLQSDGTSWENVGDDNFLWRVKPHSGKCAAFAIEISTGDSETPTAGHVIEGVDLLIEDTGGLSRAARTGAS